MRRISRPLGTLIVLLALAGCRADDGADRVVVQGDTQRVGTAQPTQTGQFGDTLGRGARAGGEPEMRIEVNLAQRELYVYRGGQRTATHPVAVGTREWPTPTGEWSIGQVVWNPRFIPPPQSWAEDLEEKEPGAPDNPLGRAQLVYNPPNSIHGTNDPSSIGQAVSHGSIRVTNEVAMDLARQVMEAGGAGRDEQWYQQARNNRSQRHDVAIPNPVPIRVVSGS